MVLGTKKAIISLISLGRIRQTIGKKIARTGRRQIEGRHLLLIIWRIFAKPNNPLAPKLDIDGGKHVLACF